MSINGIKKEKTGLFCWTELDNEKQISINRWFGGRLSKVYLLCSCFFSRCDFPLAGTHIRKSIKCELGAYRFCSLGHLTCLHLTFLICKMHVVSPAWFVCVGNWKESRRYIERTCILVKPCDPRQVIEHQWISFSCFQNELFGLD